MAAALSELLEDFITAGATDAARQSLIAHGREFVRRAGPESQLGYLPEQMANYDYLRGDYRATAAAQTQLLDDRKNTLGDEHSDTLRAMGNLALTLRAGRRARA